MTQITQPSPQPVAQPKPGKGFAIASIILSSLGLITIIIPIVGIVFGIVSLILAILYVKKVGLYGPLPFIALLLAGFATFFGAVTLIVFIGLGAQLVNNIGNV